ncbi:MAG: hypothetical protein RLZZ124_281 [Cyanobacteriota bacterium]
MPSKRITATTGISRVAFTIDNGEHRLGRSTQADLILPAAWSLASGLHLTIQLKPDGSLWVKDGCGNQSSTNGTKLNNRYLANDQWEPWPPDAELQIGSDLKHAIRIDYRQESMHESTRVPTGDRSLDRPGSIITIGRSDHCTVQIDGPTISRLHCEIRAEGSHATVIDRSKNGVFINGQRVTNPCPLAEGDEIKIGTHVFAWLKDSLIKETSGRNYRVDVRDLHLPGRIRGSNLSIEPGQLVALVGGSGAGKSSLLTTMVGQNMDYGGHIYINGNELRDCYTAIKQEIGFVPQDDIVHSELTVEEVLRYSARLKLPDPEQQRSGVERVLDELELTHRRQARVRELSGGQRKRVSIGVELIADPRILFLDEPTSGLDPGLDKRMMQLLRKLADTGKTVALVTHATNNVMLCDQVIFLGRGGYLCYAGPPSECSRFFGVSGDFADIYQFLEKPDPEIRTLAETFTTTQREQLPCLSEASQALTTRNNQHFIARLKDFGAQTRTLLSRDFKLQTRDMTSLSLNALTAPLATAMIAVAANNRSIFDSSTAVGPTSYADALRVLFVMICSSVWVGLSSTLQAIVKERPVFIRERAFNLLPEAYLSSKIAIMAGQCLIQAGLIAGSAQLLFNAPYGVDHWSFRVGVIAFATLFAIGSQALMVSSLARNNQQASSIAPLLLIPQLVFGGVLFLLKGDSKYIYPFITSRWSMRALGSVTEITGLIPGGEAAISQAPGAMDYATNGDTVTQSIMVLIAQSACLLIASLFILLFAKRNR